MNNKKIISILSFLLFVMVYGTYVLISYDTNTNTLLGLQENIPIGSEDLKVNEITNTVTTKSTNNVNTGKGTIVKNIYLEKLLKAPIAKDIINSPMLSNLILLEKYENNLNELRSNSIKIVSTISKCLKKNLCSQKNDKLNSFYDHQNTPMHNLLERNLDLLIQSYEISEYDESLVNKKVFLDLLDIGNFGIQNKAMLILFNSNLGNEVRHKSAIFLGSTRKNYLELSHAYFSKDLFEKDLIQSIDENDNLTSLGVFEMVRSVNVSQKTAQAIIQKVCPAIRNPANTSAIVLRQKIKSWSDGQNIKITDYCN